MLYQMDVGVGCFVFSQGVMMGYREQREKILVRRMKKEKELQIGGFKTMRRTLRAVLPLIVLGFARLGAIKGTEYQVCYFSVIFDIF
jgi:hypothetical protein